MTTETRRRAINDVVIATGGHDTTSLLSVGEFKDVTHKPVLQTPTAILLSDRHTTHIMDVTHSTNMYHHGLKTRTSTYFLHIFD